MGANLEPVPMLGLQAFRTKQDSAKKERPAVPKDGPKNLELLHQLSSDRAANSPCANFYFGRPSHFVGDLFLFPVPIPIPEALLRRLRPRLYSLSDTGSDSFLGDCLSNKEINSWPEAGMPTLPWRTISLALRSRP